MTLLPISKPATLIEPASALEVQRSIDNMVRFRLTAGGKRIRTVSPTLRRDENTDALLAFARETEWGAALSPAEVGERASTATARDAETAPLAICGSDPGSPHPARQPYARSRRRHPRGWL